MENPIRAALQLYIHISLHMQCGKSRNSFNVRPEDKERETLAEPDDADPREGPYRVSGSPPTVPATTGLVQV